MLSNFSTIQFRFRRNNSIEINFPSINTTFYADSNSGIFCPCLGHKTRDKGQHAIGPDIDPNKLTNSHAGRI
jgi:hypothetical protein